MDNYIDKVLIDNYIDKVLIDVKSKYTGQQPKALA